LLPGQIIDGGQVWLYIGHPHSQTDREVEVLVTVYGDGREARFPRDGAGPEVSGVQTGEP